MEAHGFTVFCDDVRAELGGKISLIGCYGADLVVQGATFPILLPKLGFLVTVRFEPTEKGRSVKILVYLPGEPEDEPAFTTEINILEEFVAQQYSQMKNEKWEALRGPGPGMDTFRHHFVLSPVILKEEGYIRVRVMHEGTRIRVGTLHIIARNAEASPANEPSRPS